MFEELIGKEVTVRVSFATVYGAASVSEDYIAVILASDSEKTTMKVSNRGAVKSILGKTKVNRKMVINNKYIIFVSEEL